MKHFRYLQRRNFNLRQSDYLGFRLGCERIRLNSQGAEVFRHHNGVATKFIGVRLLKSASVPAKRMSNGGVSQMVCQNRVLGSLPEEEFESLRPHLVTDAANALKRAGLISYTRGFVTVLDRAGMEKRTCECYGVTKREFDRLFSVFPTSMSA
jgi:hypothetical protein